MKEFEADQLAAVKDNYNKVLDVYPFPSLGSGASANAAMEEIIKKASIPIQRHKNSKWVDDSYILVGKARFYKEDWENAIQTFKFINTKFKDQDTKHLAVIWLLNTYTRMGDISNAKSVIAYLKKETLSKDNLREGALAFAYFYQRRKDYSKTLDYLSMAVELSPRSRKKGRLSYALGQLNQKFGRDEDAYKAYRSVLKCWPGFELEFYTKLNLAQVIKLADEKQIRKIRKNFKRMTRDLKYEEYLDKVYYEMGLFEIKQNDMPLGLDYLRTSLKKSKGASRQKPYTYLKLAELHYKPLRSYVWAKNYYDSTIAGLDTTDDQYKSVARRQKILGEFVKHYLTVVQEDSLRKLASMDTVALYALIDKKIQEDKVKQEKAEKLAKKMADAGSGGGDDDALSNSAFDNIGGAKTGGSGPSAGSGEWYFSNLTAVTNGRSDFRKKWGTRKLEDNWRRSNKQGEVEDADPQAQDADTSSQAKSPDGSNPKKTEDLKKEEEAKQAAEKLANASPTERRKPYLKDIPFTPEQKKASDEKLQVALFEIGKIYDQKLEEPDLAIQALERDVKEFPGYEKVPEALYNLCLLYRKQNKTEDYERCKTELLRLHPESVFAKLIVNPNYLLENKQRNEIISGLYRTVFDQYKRNMFIEASNGIAGIRTQYPKSDFEDKLAILSALITAKTVDIPTYKEALKKFMVDFPKSDLQEFAGKCLENAEKAGGPDAGKSGLSGDSVLAAAPVKKAPEFSPNLTNKQILIALIPNLNIPEAAILAAFSDFNAKFYPGDGLETTSLPFGDNTHVMIKIQELPSKIQGLFYLKKVQEAGPFKKDFKQFKPIYFVLTQENLQILYKTKGIKEYATFFAKNYDLNKELDDEIPTFGK